MRKKHSAVMKDGDDDAAGRSSSACRRNRFGITPQRLFGILVADPRVADLSCSGSRLASADAESSPAVGSSGQVPVRAEVLGAPAPALLAAAEA